MFPEGTRNTTGKLLPFKKGAFHLAIASGCPIQPVVVSRYTFLNDKERRFDDGKFLEIFVLFGYKPQITIFRKLSILF